jgi:hypothetical protein
MKSLRLIVPVILMSLSLMSPSALAQSEMHKMDAPKAAAPKSEAQTTFDTLKTLAGEWEGSVTVDPPMPKMTDGKALHVSMRVTSRGNALVHELQEAGTPLDATRYDHPVTMLYLDDDRLTLIHYCDAGNRPRMTGKMSPDGRTVEFDFADISGSTRYGHMHHAVFTVVDANRHAEDWIYMMPGDKPMHAHFDLKRVQ